MADNTILALGAGGDTLATDDIGGIKFPRTKLIVGIDGTNDGDVAATNPLPVDVISALPAGANIVGAVTQSGTWNVTNVSGTISLPTGAATAALQTTGNGILTTIDVDTGAIATSTASIDGKITACNTGAVVIASGTITAVTTITNDVNIADGGNSITVDNGGTFVVQADSVIPGTGATNIGKAIDTAAGATDTGVAILAIRDDALTTLTPVDGDYVGLRVNSTGALHVTGAGGGTQYQVNDAGGATDTGTALLAIRDDSLTTLTPVDGDYVRLRVNSTGALHVTGGGGGTEYTEDVATANPIVGTATMMERDDAITTVAPAEGDWISFRGSAEGALWTQDFNSDAILADTTSIDGKITACNTGAVVISSGTVTTVSAVTAITNALPAGTNNIGDVDVLTVPAPLSTTGGGTEAAAMRITVASDSTGLLSVDDNGASLTADVPAVATGGATPGKLISAATTNATSVKASAATLYSLQVFNLNAAARYLKLYNKASAPTVGTDVPVQVYMIPGNTAGAGLVVPIPTSGIAFGTGLAFALTTGIADTDTAAVAANEICLSYSYN